MVPKIKRILYATDLSENARYAFSYAADLAQRYDANMTIVSVMEILSPFAEKQVQEMMGHEDWDKLKSGHLEYSKQKIKERVSDFCKSMEKHIDACDLMVDDIQIPKGVPYKEILKAAENVNADMIVMGTHGYNILEDSLIGGTARRIIKDSKIPVLVIRLPEDEE